MFYENDTMLRWMENASNNGYGSNHDWENSKDISVECKKQTKNAMLTWVWKIMQAINKLPKG